MSVDRSLTCLNGGKRTKAEAAINCPYHGNIHENSPNGSKTAEAIQTNRNCPRAGWESAKLETNDTSQITTNTA
jgi:hypothetical protein